jgi:hypothetical protein
VQRDVIAGVDDCSDILGRDDLHNPFEKARSAHAARACNDHGFFLILSNQYLSK